VLQPDLAIAGGLTEGVRIDAIASAYNLRLAPHLWSGAPAFAAGVGSAASAYGLAAIINRDLAPLLVGQDPRDVSRLWDVMYMLHDLVHEKFTVVDGQLEIPDRPGLGITVDEDFVRRHARD